jgi:hypothetical protein
MLGVDTGLSFLSNSVASPALTASVIRPTIAATETVHTTAQNLMRWGRLTALRGPSTMDLIAWLTYSSLLFACGLIHCASMRFQPPPEGTYQYAGSSSTWPCANACLACSFCPRFWVDELPVKCNILTIMGKIGL